MSRLVAFTNGCFDLLGAHHVSFLERCKQQCDVLIVGLNTDESVSRLKGSIRPIVPFATRKQMIESLRCVDLVVPMPDSEPSDWIRRLMPNLVFKGFPKGKPDTWNESNMPEIALCRELEIPLVFLEGPDESTTQMIERIKNA
jgi:D-beta-D-heptose 7-phosphate kinase/D-beta-D-heptose 1-phosphate adenosyltransferase